MTAAVLAFSTLEELATFVRTTLCERDTLDATQTPLFRTPMLKAGKMCGMVFHIVGPRLLKTSAVWTAASDRILFYDSTGTRFHEVRLSESPSLAECAVPNADAKAAPPRKRAA